MKMPQGPASPPDPNELRKAVYQRENADFKQRFRDTPERIKDREELSNAIEALKVEGREDIINLVTKGHSRDTLWEENYQIALDRISGMRERYDVTEEADRKKIWEEIYNLFFVDPYDDLHDGLQQVSRLAYLLNGYFPDSRNPSPAIVKIREVMTRREKEFVHLLEEVGIEYERTPKLLSVPSERVREFSRQHFNTLFNDDGIPKLHAVPEIKTQAWEAFRRHNPSDIPNRPIVDAPKGMSIRISQSRNGEFFDIPPAVTVFDVAAWAR